MRVATNTYLNVNNLLILSHPVLFIEYCTCGILADVIENIMIFFFSKRFVVKHIHSNNNNKILIVLV